MAERGSPFALALMQPTDPGVAAELLFDGAYLLTLWALVAALLWRLPRVPAAARWSGGPLVWAFALLAVGNTAHVGLRLLALGLGAPQLALPLGEWRLPLIGFGALCTAITVTLFYPLLLLAHHRLSGRPWSLMARILLAVALLRLVLLALPQNAWGQVLPPQPWSLLRNLPLLALTLGVGATYLRCGDGAQRWQRTVGGLLVASALFHLPVVLWIQWQPLLGLLMIPKSIAYVLVAWTIYRRLPSMAPITSV